MSGSAGFRTELGVDGERIFLDSKPQKRRRWSRRRRRASNQWTPQEVYDHVVGCYQAGPAQMFVVVAMPGDELPQKLVDEVCAMNDGAYMQFEWWGFGWGGEWPLAIALSEEPHVLCEAHGSAATEEEARTVAKAWLFGDEPQESLREVSLLDVPRWPLLATLEVVRLGAGNAFQRNRPAMSDGRLSTRSQRT